jgi:hypothetical protein
LLAPNRGKINLGSIFSQRFSKLHLQYQTIRSHDTGTIRNFQKGVGHQLGGRPTPGRG